MVTESQPSASTRRRSRPPGVRTRCRGTDGAVLVEAAFVLPVLLWLLLATFDGSLQFLDYLTTGNALRQALRTASVAGNDGTADFTVLASVAAGSRAIRRGDLRQLVVYEASGLTATVPPGCAAGIPSSVAGQRCNVYTEASGALRAPATDLDVFGCVPGRSADRFFCPTTRKTAAQGPNGPPSWIGVALEVRHTYVSKLFGSSVTMRADGVVRLEPASLQ